MSGQHQQPWLTASVHQALSAYHAVRDGKLRRRLPGTRDAVAEPSPLTSFVHDSFVALVNNGHFPCLGARSAVRRGTLRFAVYPQMASVRTTLGLLADLWSFTREFPPGGTMLATFVAAFDGPQTCSEVEFEELLWRQLQELHDVDAIESNWDAEVSSDPDAANFSFSVAGRAMFVIGLHPAASRWARRFSWPTLVFNPHDQFETLRRTEQMEQMKSVIRKRDTRLQGRMNQVLADHGQSSEARQYSGRAVEPEWRCPFTPRHSTPNVPDQTRRAG
jgi:FPC/CPF motif-containing protein YcgG